MHHLPSHATLVHLKWKVTVSKPHEPAELFIIKASFECAPSVGLWQQWAGTFPLGVLVGLHGHVPSQVLHVQCWMLDVVISGD